MSLNSMKYLINPRRIYKYVWKIHGFGEMDIWIFTKMYFVHRSLTFHEICLGIGITQNKPEVVEYAQNSIAKMLKRGYFTESQHKSPQYQLTPEGMKKYGEVASTINDFVTTNLNKV